MTGPGSAPPHYRPPNRGKVISLRVLFMVLTLLSVGVLSWTAMLCIAILRRRRLDWVLFCVVLVLSVMGFALAGGTPEDHWLSDAGVTLMFLLAFGVASYYLAVDIRLHDAGAYPYPPVPPGPYGPPQPFAAPFPAPSYGYPQGQPPHRFPQDQPPGFPQDRLPQPPSRPAPQRIDQVRAELDELSRQLRKEDGR